MSPMFSTELARLHHSELLRFARQRPTATPGTPRRRFWRRRAATTLAPAPVGRRPATTMIDTDEGRRVA